MKIKEPSRKNLLRRRLKARAAHWWLAPEKPKKMGRLGQLNKHNHYLKSEFVRMAEYIEERRLHGR